MADALGVDQQGVEQSPEGTSLDYLGVRSPTAFRGQPALPTGGPVAPGTAAPATTGAGTGAKGPTGLQPTTSGDVATTTFADLAGAGGSDTSAGQSPSVGGAGSFPASFDLANINLGNLGLVAPESSLAGVGGRVGPTGTVSPTTGNQFVDQALSIVGRALDVPTSINLLSQAAQMFGAPALSALAGITGPVGALLTAMQLTHAISQNVDGTIASQIKETLANPNLNEHDVATIMNQIAQGFPYGGGPQAIGTPGRVAMGLDNPVTNVNASTQAAPTAPAANLAEAGTLTPTFAALANALGMTGRADEGPAAPPGIAPTEGISPADAVGGNPDGPSGPGPSGDGGSGAP